MNSMEINTVDYSQSIGSNDVNEVIALEEESEKSIQQQGGKRKRKLTSPIWRLFYKLQETFPDGKERLKCRKCGIMYVYTNKDGTGNMLSHMSTCPKLTMPHDPIQMYMKRNEGNVLVRPSKFEPNMLRELLVIALIRHDLPFQFVEYEGIRNIFQYLQDQVPFISKNTAKSDVVKIYNSEKEKIKCLLEETPSRICLTSDLWTSLVTDGYLSLTAHFVDKEWTLQKKVLNFCHMPPPHNGVCLAEKILSLLCDWGIENKIFSLTLDNASSNDICVHMLKTQLQLRRALMCGGDFFHIRCCAHILNLIVQDGLMQIKDQIDKIRESVKYIKGSQVRKQKFLECAKQVSLDCKKGLRQDVPTRWNSTYLMLESVLYYKRAFCHLQLSDSNYKYCPSEDEWDKVEKINEFLSIFYEITCIFSGTRYPTANLYFPKVFAAYMTLKQLIESEDNHMRDMAEKMMTKYLKYWSEFCMILAIALILDPRYKMSFVEFAYKKVYGPHSAEFNRVRDKLFSLFNEYMVNFVGSSSTTTSTTFNVDSIVPPDNTSFNKTLDILKEFDDFESMDYNPSFQKTQLELYLDEPRVDRNMDLDILSFWKGNQFRYPNLALMARDVLTIPISTVASESAFSVGGRVLDQYRSTLKPNTVEALVCTRDWLFGENVNASVQLDDLIGNIMNLDIDSTPTAESRNQSIGP